MVNQSAIIAQEPGRAIIKQDAPLPDLPDNYILVKTKAGIWPFCPLWLPCLMFGELK
jgi:hypothetical protein